DPLVRRHAGMDRRRDDLALSRARNRRRLSRWVALRSDFDRRAMLAEGDDVAVFERCLTLDRLAVHERAVRALMVGDEELAPPLQDRAMFRRHVEIELRVEPQIARRFSADEDRRLIEDFRLAGARSRENAKSD